MNAAIIGAAILLISVFGSLFFVKRKATERQTKVMLFVLYFWVLAFFQLIIAAIAYSVLTQ